MMGWGSALAIALLMMVCSAAASNATSHPRLLAEREAPPNPGRLRISSGSTLKGLISRVDNLERRFDSLMSRPPARAARRDTLGSIRRSREVSSLQSLGSAAKDGTARHVAPHKAQGQETVCVAVPCAPKHWPLVRRVMRSVAQQTLAPQKVLVALSHTEAGACAAKQAELRGIFAGAELHCIGGAGWTRGKNRNLAAAACGNVSIIAYIDADDQMHPRRLERMVDLMRQHGAHLGLHSYTEVLHRMLRSYCVAAA